MRQKYFLTALGILLSSGIQAHAGLVGSCSADANAMSSDAGIDQPIQSKDSKVTEIIRKGPGGATLSVGANSLVAPFAIECSRKVSCVFTATSMAGLDGIGFQFYVCTYVDGKSMHPQPYIVSSYGMAIQSLKIPNGSHTVESEIYIVNQAVQLDPWTISYTLYD